jgi:hypothetical protein
LTLVHTEAEMRTARQIEASRINGSRSRGPVTDAGKSKSSRNSRSHGLYSKTVEPGDIPGCVIEAIARFRAGLEAEYGQGHSAPDVLVENSVRAYGLFWRIVALEKTVMCDEIARQRLAHPGKSDLDLQSFAFRRLSDETGVLQLIGRLEGRFSRLYQRAIDRLHSRGPLEIAMECEFAETNPAHIPEKSKNAETNPGTPAEKTKNAETNPSQSPGKRQHCLHPAHASTGSLYGPQPRGALAEHLSTRRKVPWVRYLVASKGK